jgi:phosphoadenosine phosphosulfate reductase
MNTAEILPVIPQFDLHASAEEIFLAGRELAGGKIALACSFGIENVVLIDQLRQHLQDVTVFAIDTGRLHEETYAVADSISQRYGIAIHWFFPRHENVEQLTSEKGLFSFRESLANRKECCHIRKVEPLRRALTGFSAWTTGMRRAQSVTRTGQEPIEIDAVNGGLLKINPLTFWSEQRVWDYAERHALPVNRLHRQGYPSIGCAPCTRAVEPGEDHRAGRWWWEDPEHKECGLHRREEPTVGGNGAGI